MKGLVRGLDYRDRPVIDSEQRLHRGRQSRRRCILSVAFMTASGTIQRSYEEVRLLSTAVAPDRLDALAA